ncbi:MAG: uracil-DNA glycosylase [Anaerolineae bacterium]
MSDSLDQVATEIAGCTKCALHAGRTKTVPGAGSPNAEIMFIGEGPGFHEDQSGLPFVGRAGDFLNELLGTIGLAREDVFIANVVKCRPPQNRDPKPKEIEACSDYLQRQIDLINPKIIVTLGRFSMARWFPNAKISEIHGTPYRFGDRLVVPFYHPVAALRRASLQGDVRADFNTLPGLIEKVAQGDFTGIPVGAIGDEPPQQLSLF